MSFLSDKIIKRSFQFSSRERPKNQKRSPKLITWVLNRIVRKRETNFSQHLLFTCKPISYQRFSRQSCNAFTSIRFLKTIKAEEFQVSNGKMLIDTSSWRFVRNFCSQVQQFLAWAMTGFALGVYKLHTQYFSDLTFLPHELSCLRLFRKVLPDKVKETTLSEKITLAEYTLEFLT